MDFGPLAPDQPDLNNPGIRIARNVLPRLRGYDSLPALNRYMTGTLPSRARGAFSAKDAQGNTYVFAGTETQLWSLSGTVWTDVSRVAPAYTSANRWEFTQFGDLVIASHLDDVLQSIDLGGANYANLTVSNVAGATVATIRGFVVIGNVKDDDGHSTFRVRWSPLDNPAGDWTPDPTTLADFQDLRSTGGKVQRIVGGEYGMVFRERSTYRGRLNRRCCRIGKSCRIP